MSFKDPIEFQKYMQSMLSSQNDMAKMLQNMPYPISAPEQEMSPETMKMLVEDASQIGSIVRSINRLSNKIDENQHKAEEQIIKQQKNDKRNFS